MYVNKYTLLLLCLSLNTLLKAQTAKSIPTQMLNLESATYLKTQDRVYGAVSDRGFGIHDNNILVIDPAWGTVEKTLNLGFNPNHICASTDEQFIFFTSDGPLTLKRLRTSTNQVDMELPIQHNRRVIGIKPVPGEAQNVVIMSNSFQRDTTFIELVEGTGIQSARIIVSNPGYIINFGFADDSTIVAWQPDKLLKIRIRSTGLTLFQTLTGVPFYEGDQGVVTNSRIISRTGRVINFSQAQLFEEPVMDPAYFMLNSDYDSDVFYGMRPVGNQEENRIRFTRFKKADISIDTSWEVTFMQRLNWSFSGDGKLHITGKDRFLFKFGGFTNIVWNCTPSLSAPVITPSGDVLYCPNGDSVVLSVNLANAPEVLWSNGSSNPQLRTKEFGAFSARYTDSKGCQTPFSAPTNVDFYTPSLVSSIASEQGSGYTFTICKNGTINLRANSYFENAKKWIWSTGDTTQAVRVTAGTYTVRMISVDGCESDWSPSIKINERAELAPPRPVITLLNNDNEICNGENAVFETTPGYKYYLWNPSSVEGYQTTINHNINFNYSITVTVRVGNAETCISEPSEPVRINFYAAPPKPVISLQGNKLVSNNASSIHQWYVNDVLLQGATGSSIPVQGGGFYSAKVFDGRCNSDYSNFVAVSGKITSTDHPGLRVAFAIYPIPVQDELQIELPDLLRNQKLVLRVFGADGRQLLLNASPTQTSKGTSISTVALSKGMYWLDVQAGTERFRYKFVKL